MELRELLMAAADLRVRRMFRQLAAMLLTLAMKSEILLAHGRLQQSTRQQLDFVLLLAPRRFAQRQHRLYITATITIRIWQNSAD